MAAQALSLTREHFSRGQSFEVLCHPSSAPLTALYEEERGGMEVEERTTTEEEEVFENTKVNFGERGKGLKPGKQKS
eukprot:3563919-Rhodomonas_salina.3